MTGEHATSINIIRCWVGTITTAFDRTALANECTRDIERLNVPLPSTKAHKGCEPAPIARVD